MSLPTTPHASELAATTIPSFAEFIAQVPEALGWIDGAEWSDLHRLPAAEVRDFLDATATVVTTAAKVSKLMADEFGEQVQVFRRLMNETGTRTVGELVEHHAERVAEEMGTVRRDVAAVDEDVQRRENLG